MPQPPQRTRQNQVDLPAQDGFKAPDGSTPSHAFLALLRDTFKTDFWNEPRRFSKAEAWIDLLQRTAYGPFPVTVGGRKVMLQPGEVLAGAQFYADRWEWSRSTVQRFFRDLEARGWVAVGQGKWARGGGQGPKILKPRFHAGFQDRTSEKWAGFSVPRGRGKRAQIEEGIDKEQSISLRASDGLTPGDVRDLWNDNCPTRRVSKLTAAREKATAARIGDAAEIAHESPDFGDARGVFAHLFTFAESDDFHSGRKGRWDGASFDWLMKTEDRFRQTIEKATQGNRPHRSITKNDNDETDYSVPPT